MTPQNLSIATSALATADRDCITVVPGDVTAWLVACADYPLPSRPASGSDGYHVEGPWLSRAVMAWGRVRSEASSIDRAKVDWWFIQAGSAILNYQRSALEHLFPARSSGNYAAVANEAESGALFSKPLYLGGPTPSHASLFYNNRRTVQTLALGLIGIVLGVQPFIDEAKRYVKEWVMFAVWPSGLQSEWSRNDDYDVAAQGVIYGTPNIALALTLAHELHKRGDDDLLNYSTSAGLFGTEANGTPKTIWTAYDLHMAMLLGSVTFNSPAGQPMNAFNPQNRRAMHPSWYWPAAVAFHRDAPLRKWAEVQTPTGNSNDDPYGPWHGVCGIYADARAA